MRFIIQLIVVATVISLIIGGLNALIGRQPTESSLSPHSSPSSVAATQMRFSFSVSGGAYPVISGSTNDLSDGTRLLVNLKRPWLPDATQRLARGLAACGENCLPATGPDHQLGILVTLVNHGFVAGPFSFNGRPFAPGDYPLEISLSADLSADQIEKVNEIGTVVFKAALSIRGQATPSGEIVQWSRFDGGGKSFAIDLNSLSWTSSGERAVVICTLDHDTCSSADTRHAQFDCHGHYRNIDDRESTRIGIQSGSVASQIEASVCDGRTRDNTQRRSVLYDLLHGREGEAQSQSPPPTPSIDDARTYTWSGDDDLKTFNSCLVANAKKPEYTSYDGGKSAMLLLGDCPRWKDLVGACVSAGNSDSECVMKVTFLAQLALKLLGK